MTKIPPGQTIPGTVWHEQVRLAPGGWMHVDSVATEVEPPRRLAMDFRSRYFAGHLTYDITATEGGTIVRQREILLPRRLVGRTVDPAATRAPG